MKVGVRLICLPGTGEECYPCVGHIGAETTAWVRVQMLQYTMEFFRQ